MEKVVGRIRNTCAHDGCDRRGKKKWHLTFDHNRGRGRVLAKYRFCGQNHRDLALQRVNDINRRNRGE